MADPKINDIQSSFSDYLDAMNKVAERIKIAREFGDLSENSEYDEAKNAQANLCKKSIVI